MSEATSIVLIESLEQIDNETIELILKYENLNVHGQQTLKCLDAMRRERQLCDVILTVEGHELFAHRAVISCHSNYFLELFLSDENDPLTKKQVYYQIDGVEYMVLKLIIQFIYQGSFRLTSELVPKIYLAANQLRIEALFKACSNHLSQMLTAQNCLSTRLLAMDDELRTKANEYIANHFLDVLETREFHILPTVKLELVDSPIIQQMVLCNLIINFVAQQLSKDDSNLQELCEYMHLLYLSGENLQDCADMDDTNIHFSDLIKDYQSYKLTKRNLSTSSSSTQNENSIFETPYVHLANNRVPSNLTINSRMPETKLVHMSQSSEHSYIIIAIIMGKMLTISVHISPSPSSPQTPEYTTNFPTDKMHDETIQSTNTPTLAFDKQATLSSLLTARCCFGTVSMNDKIYAVGGYNRGDCLDTIEEYDPLRNKWTILGPRMSKRRGRVSAAIVKNKLYVCGGSDGQKELNTGECFDLISTHKWSMIKELSSPIAHSAMCSDGNYVYAIGGIEGDKCKRDCYKYNPANNTWSTLSSMNSERSQAGVVYFNEKIYAFGGTTLNRCLSSCEILTLSTNEWIMGPTMKEPRRGCGAVLYNNKIFIIGGSNGVSSLTSIEILDPVTCTWVIHVNGLANELNTARVGVGVTVCCDKIYVIGGFDGRSFLKTIEVYDEHNQQWTLTHHGNIPKPNANTQIKVEIDEEEADDDDDNNDVNDDDDDDDDDDQVS